MSASVYRWEAVSGEGDVRVGLMGAEDRVSVLRQLAAQDLFPLSVEREDAGGAETLARGGNEEAAAALRMLGLLTDAGLPLRRALDLLSDLAPRGWGPRIHGARREVEAGNALSSALQSAGLPLPPMALGFLAAGEQTGTLGPALLSAADMMDRRREASAAVRKALAYPTTLAVVAVGSAGFIAIAVIPRFAGILADLGAEIPLSTRLVLGASDLVRVGFAPALGLLLVTALGVRLRMGTLHGRRAIHRRLLAIPVVGAMRLAASSRHACSLAAHLLRSGVSADRTLSLLVESAEDAEIASRLGEVRSRIAEGLSLADALERSEALDPIAIRFARIGEESGSLPAALDHAARLLEHRLIRQLERTTRAIEPALIVGFGVIVGLIAAGLFQAIYGVQL